MPTLTNVFHTLAICEPKPVIQRPQQEITWLHLSTVPMSSMLFPPVYLPILPTNCLGHSVHKDIDNEKLC